MYEPLVAISSLATTLEREEAALLVAKVGAAIATDIQQDLAKEHDARLASLGGMKVQQRVQYVMWEALLQKEYFPTVKRYLSASAASALVDAGFVCQPLLALQDVRNEEKRAFAAQLLPLVKREHEELIAERVRTQWEDLGRSCR